MIRRITLVEQTAEHLRRGIARGEWRGQLPSERQLCHMLQVSRDTLRLALARLRTESLIETGSRRTLVKAVRPRRPESAQPRRIAVLTPVSLERMPPLAQFLCAEVAGRLSATADGFEIVRIPPADHSVSRRQLDRIIEKHPADVWLILAATQQIQEWVVERNLPAFLLGNALEGIRLPNLNVDYAAATRHAVHQLQRLGHDHRRLCMAVPRAELAGSVLARHTFLKETASEDTDRQLLLHHEDGSDIMAQLERHLRREERPTAIIVMRPSVAVTLLTAIAHRHRLTVPGDISLIVLEYAAILSTLYPPLAHYHVNVDRVSRHVIATINQMLSVGPLHPRKTASFVPSFIAGGSIAPPVCV